MEVHAPHGACAGAALAARVVPLEGFSNKEPLIIHCYGRRRTRDRKHSKSAQAFSEAFLLLSL